MADATDAADVAEVAGATAEDEEGARELAVDREEEPPEAGPDQAACDERPGARLPRARDDAAADEEEVAEPPPVPPSVSLGTGSHATSAARDTKTKRRRAGTMRASCPRASGRVQPACARFGVNTRGPPTRAVPLRLEPARSGW